MSFTSGALEMLGDFLEPGTVNHPYCRIEKEGGGSHLTFYKGGLLRFIFNYDGNAPALNLVLSNLTAPRGAAEGFSPINITVNRKAVASRWNPGSSQYVTSAFAITPYLCKGSNAIRLSLDPTATSCYWLKALKISVKAN